ncbi:MAG TPA: VOC family protein [Candidatus Binatia bacterium]|nr:VOC family protein [Candidatus Binatia bacterium]
MGHWYSRPVLFVADVGRALDFYVGKLGFREKWRFQQEVAQVDRDDCEIIVSAQRPPKIGMGMLFVELTAADFGALPSMLSNVGVASRRARWGYECIIIADPDGNEIYFPDPNDPGDSGVTSG